MAAPLVPPRGIRPCGNRGLLVYWFHNTEPGAREGKKKSFVNKLLIFLRRRAAGRKSVGKGTDMPDKKESAGADKSGVQSIARIFEIIEVLAAHPAGVGLQQLAAEAELAKSTAHRLLASLITLGYARQDSTSGHYRLTLKMFEISSGIVNSMDIMGVAKVHLERLAQRTGDAVHLVIRDGQDIVYIYKTESGPMRMSSRVGLRSPLYCTGVGKAIMATLTDPEVADIWRHSTPSKLTEHTVVDFETLMQQMGEVRGCHYALDDEENELGIRCVAVAIPGPGGRADSAFSISGLAPYMTPERIQKIAAMALETRGDILHDLGLSDT